MTITEIFFTILVIWILFRIFRSDTPKKQSDTTVYQSKPPEKKEIKGGEYVDYEEIKD